MNLVSHGHEYYTKHLALGDIYDKVFVLSCPDYGDNGQSATFEKLGTGVPIMVRQHLGALQLMGSGSTIIKPEANLNVWIADLEHENPLLPAQFTGGSVDVFRDKVDASVASTETFFDELEELGFGSFVVRGFSTICCTENGSNKFTSLREDYRDQILSTCGGELASRLKRLIRYKLKDEYYAGVYQDLTELEVRTIEASAMAEYIALGRTVAEMDGCAKLIAVHHSPNVDLFNYYNKLEKKQERIATLVRGRLVV